MMVMTITITTTGLMMKIIERSSSRMLAKVAVAGMPKREDDAVNSRMAIE